MTREIKKKSAARLPNERKLSEQDRALLSKLIRRDEHNTLHQGNNDRAAFKHFDLSTINNLAINQAQRQLDADNIFQVLPEMILAKEIVTSLVTSPDELVETDLLYTIENSDFDDSVAGPLLRAIQKRSNGHYKIKELVADMVGDVLFGSGSYPLLILPESSIDQIINSDVKVTLESIVGGMTDGTLYKSLGLLGDGTEESLNRPALERIINRPVVTKAAQVATDLGYSVIDTPDIMKQPKLTSRLNEETIRTALSDISGIVTPALEAHAKVKERPTLKQTEEKFYPKRVYDVVPTQMVLTPKQISAGVNRTSAILMHLKSDSVVRVYTPGNIKNMIGAFVAIDANGNSLSVATHQNYFDDLRRTMQNKSSATSRILERVKQSYGGSDCNELESQRRQTEAYGELMEDDLQNRLRSGALTGDFELAYSDDFVRFLFSRCLKRKHTNMLFVPRELLMYFAVDYNSTGFGKSLLEDGKLLASLRATMLFSDIHAAVKNATGTQTININVPEKSGNPYGDMKDMLNFHHELNSDSLPYATINPRDITAYLARAGKNVKVTGNQAFPDVDFNIEERAGVYKEGNSELSDRLKKAHVNSFLLTPELLDAADSADFASEVKQNRVFLMKRIVKIQNKLNPEITRTHRTIVNNDGILRTELVEILKNKSKDLTKEQRALLTNEAGLTKLIETFTKSMYVRLPRPNVENVSDHKERIEQYADLIEKVYEYSFNDEIFVEDQTGALQDATEAVRKSLVAAAVRKFMVENNICPEINNLTTFEEEEGLLEMLQDDIFKYNEHVIKAMEKFMKKITKAGNKRKEAQAKAEADAEALANPTEDTDATEEPLEDPDATDDDLDEPTVDDDDLDTPPDDDLDDVPEDLKF